MKIFISWSGVYSKKLGEAIREWLPSVIQSVVPYFTPSDIEKGARWSADIAKELDEAQIGLICVTRDNLHSDWILFEAGALSKSLTKGHVCPILFGIKNADLAGPLKQFQTTEFDKAEFFKLIGIINSKLENKLPPKNLELAFDMWWPALEKKIKEILAEEVATADQPSEPIRSDRDLLEELLQLHREAARRAPLRVVLRSEPVIALVTEFIALHEQQAQREGSYQDALELLHKMRKPVEYIIQRASRSEELAELADKFRELRYHSEPEADEEPDEDIL